MLKYASVDLLSVDGGPTFRRVAHRAVFDYEPRKGFLYVRSRAISSRCNENYDEFPADEIRKGWRSFVGKPVFVNHHNDDPRRARGVIIDAALHDDVNPDGSPDVWVEVLMEVDAVNYPKLAKAILRGDIERTSMGVNVEESTCSVCGNSARTPLEFCRHIPRMKGQKIAIRGTDGSETEVLCREICAGLDFFENSLLVEDPADPTAFFLGVDDRGVEATYTGSLAKAAAKTASDPVESAQGEILGWGFVNKAGVTNARSHLILRKADGALDTACHVTVDRDALDPTGAPTMAEVCRACLRLLDGAPDHIARPHGYATLANLRTASDRETCSVCGGSGYLPQFAGYANGVCFPCKGLGWVSHNPNRRSVGLSPAEVERRQQESQDYDAAMAARFRQGWPDLAALLERNADLDEASQILSYSMRMGRPGPAPISNALNVLAAALFSADRLDDARQAADLRDSGKVASHRTAKHHKEAAVAPRTAFGETKAPAKIDTLREDACPVCGNEETYDGASPCGTCGYLPPPDPFTDPDLGMATRVDLRGDQPLDPSLDPAQMDPGSKDPSGGQDLECPSCGSVFPSGPTAPTSAPDLTADPSDATRNIPAGPTGDVTEDFSLQPTDQPDAKADPTKEAPDGKDQDQPVPDAAPGADEAKPFPPKPDDDPGKDGDAPPEFPPGKDQAAPAPGDAPQPPQDAPSDDAAPGNPLEGPEDGGAPPGPADGAPPVTTGGPALTEGDPAASGGTEVQAGQPCPNCGQGTLQAVVTDQRTTHEQPVPPSANDTAGEIALMPTSPADQVDVTTSAPSDGPANTESTPAQAPTDAPPADKPDGDKPDEKPPSDEDTDKTDDGDEPVKTKPSPNKDRTKTKESRLMRPALRTIAEQEVRLQAQQEQINVIARLAGLEPQTQAIQAQAARKISALRKRADEQNPAQPVPEPGSQSAPATTEEARSTADDVSDHPTGTGTASDTPAASTEVGDHPAGTGAAPSVDTAQPPPATEVDVAAPIAGSNPEDFPAKTEITPVTLDSPQTGDINAAEGTTGWADGKAASVTPEERTFAALRLARLRIKARIASGDDIALGHEIAKSAMTDEAMVSEISTLDQVVRMAAAAAPQAGAPVAPRNLVPRHAAVTSERQVPSLATVASGPSVSSAPDDAEFLFD